MKTNTRHLLAALAGFLLIMPLVPAQKAPSAAEAPSLLEIMQGLNADTIQLTNALMTHDWATMASSARSIADHPPIPRPELKRIAGALGERTPEFKELDMQVHDAAVEIGKAAEDRDLDRASRRFTVMIEGCTSCHSKFRDEVRELRLDTERAD